MEELRTVRINTTAFEEEDFVISTTLTDEEITKVLKPIVMDERIHDYDYDNEYLIEKLQEHYKGRRIERLIEEYLSI